jgi:N-methylhydantoinase B
MPSLNEFLEIVSTDAGEWMVRCARCGHWLCPAGENHKLHALLHEGPVQEAGPHVDPHGIGGGRFVFRQFFCPGCMALINTEVAQRGEPILWDVQIAVPQQAHQPGPGAA